MKTIIKLVFIVNIIGINAQNNISGKITDSITNDTISWADVILYQGETLVTAVITNDAGEFLFEDIKDGNYTLKAHYLGYKEYSIDLILKNKERKQLVITLENNVSELDEVVVIAEKTTIEHKGDRKIINLGNDILAISSSAGDILNELPSVKVSEEGNVSLRGNQNATIFINGKKSSLSNDKLINQLPPESILKIEIITNPSAKYQAEGLSGIINIITKKNREKGGNINISSGFGTGKFARTHTDLGVNYGSEKFKAHIDYNYSERYWDHITTKSEERENKTFTSNSKSYSKNKTPYSFKAGLDIFIDSTNTLSLSSSFSKNNYISYNETNSIETNTTTLENSPILSTANSLDTGTNSDFNINYRKEFNGLSNYLEADANYSSSPYDYFSNRKIEIPLISNRLDNDSFFNKSNVSTYSLDYYKSTDKSVLELGSRFEFKSLNDKTQSTTNTVPPVETNIDYKYKDNIYAAYAVYEKSLNKITLKGGLRLEHTKLTFKSFDDKFDKKYTNIFPSASIAYKNNGHSFSLNYSRRISRPSVWALRSTVMQSDNYSQYKGNPNINPEYANKMEFNYYKKFSNFNISSSLFYMRVNDVIGHVSSIEGDFVVSSMDNVGASEDYGLELDMTIDFLKWWNTTFSSYYYFMNYKTNEFLNNKTFYQSYSVNNTFKLPKNFRIQANAKYSPKNTSLQKTNYATYNLNLAVSKDIFNKKGKIILKINDVFNSHRHGSYGVINGYNVKDKSVGSTSRHVYLTFKYNLGFGEKINKKRNRKNRNYTKKQ